MKKYQVNISDPAKNDLTQIYEYIFFELKEPNKAKKLLQKIKMSIFSLENMPERNALVFDEYLAMLGIRKILIENFITFYIIDNKANSVFIVRVLYKRRDWLNILQ